MNTQDRLHSIGTRKPNYWTWCRNKLIQQPGFRSDHHLLPIPCLDPTCNSNAAQLYINARPFTSLIRSNMGSSRSLIPPLLLSQFRALAVPSRVRVFLLQMCLSSSVGVSENENDDYDCESEILLAEEGNLQLFHPLIHVNCWKQRAGCLEPLDSILDSPLVNEEAHVFQGIGVAC
ncbi:hypothetical protein E2542_SST22937 [Spatholobus suberectus]|nr:hypothetical protein E2542_SST22937 [Spatholobus suberectus]